MLVILKSRGLVRPVAKGLAGGVAATAKCNCAAAAQAIGPTFHVDEFNFAFDAKRAVIADRDFCRGHLCSYTQSYGTDS